MEGERLISNRAILTEYINEIGGPHRFIREAPRSASKPRIMHCLLCGKPYVISIPYQLCNPETRDLCDDCMEAGKVSPPPPPPQSGSAPELIRVVKLRGDVR
jgi:hypothetical protein